MVLFRQTIGVSTLHSLNATYSQALSSLPTPRKQTSRYSSSDLWLVISARHSLTPSTTEYLKPDLRFLNSAYSRALSSRFYGPLATGLINIPKRRRVGHALTAFVW